MTQASPQLSLIRSELQMINPNHAAGTNSLSFLYTDTEGEESKKHTVASHQGALQGFWLAPLDVTLDRNKTLTEVLCKSDLSRAK